LEIADIYNDWNWLPKLKKSCGNFDDYGTDDFFERGYRGYLDFLEQARTVGVKVGPPTFIDLFWHSHQINPEYYIHDCNLILARLLPHYPLGTFGGWNFLVYESSSSYDSSGNDDSNNEIDK